MKQFLAFLSVVFITINLSAQVNIQTGSADYNIPLYSYIGNKGLSTSVSLSYSSGGGFKPSELASNVGTGWSLIAGGFIQRIQVGEPDDQDSRQAFPPSGTDCNTADFSLYNCYTYDMYYPNINGNNYIKNYYPNGYLYSEYSVASFSVLHPNCFPSELASNPRFKNYDRPWKMSRRALADRQQDKFLFNINGRVGEFMIGKTVNGQQNILIPNGAKLKIEYDDSQDLSYLKIRTRIKSFKVIDENGLVYKFNDYALTRVMEYGRDNGLLQAATTNTQGQPIPAWYNTHWPNEPETYKFSLTNTSGALNSISACPPGCRTAGKSLFVTTPLVENARLNPFFISKWYLSEVYNPLTKESIYFDYTEKWQDNIVSRSTSFTQYDGDNAVYFNYSDEREIVKNKILSSIKVADGTEIKFIYSNIARVDYKENEPLTRVEKNYKGRLNEFFNFSYGYFFKNSIVTYSSGSTYTGNDVRYLRLCLQSVQRKAQNVSEPSYSFSYYNGLEPGDYYWSGAIVSPIHSFNVDYWGYPIGAFPPSLNLYDNQFSSPYRSDYTQGLVAQIGLIKTIRTPLGGELLYKYKESYAKDISGAEKICGGVKVESVTQSWQYAGTVPIKTTYKYVLADGTSSGWGYEMSSTGENKSTISFYDARNEYGGSWKPATQIAVSFISRMVTDPIRFAIRYLVSATVGQVLASVIANSAIVTTIVTAIVDTIYTALFGSDIGTDIAIWLGWAHNTTEEKTYREYSYFPIHLRNPIGIHYSRVEVEIEGANSGKTVYEYSRPSADLHEILPYSKNPAPRYAIHRFDNLISTKMLDKNGVLVKEIKNVYTPPTVISVSDDFRSCYFDVEKSYSEPFVNNNYLSAGVITPYFYKPIAGCVMLDQVVEDSYLNGSIVNTETTKYIYDPATQLLRTTTSFNSKGEEITTKNYYTSDFPASSVLSKLVNTYNVYATQVSQITTLKRDVNATPVLVGAAHTNFTELPNGDIKPTAEYKSELLAPVSSTLISNPVDPNNPTAEGFMKLQAITTYDDASNPIAITTATNKNSCLLYDYDDRYVVAQVVNALPENCGFNSFEGTNPNNLKYDVTGIVPDKAITGQKCYDASYSLSFPKNIVTNTTLSTVRRYLSFWWQGQAPTVTLSTTLPNKIAVLKEQTNNIQGWTFYLYEIPDGITGVTLTSSTPNTCFIDEVRCYPITARMTTTAYNLPFGKSSICDASSRLAFYEYDEFGRIIKELDENRNIIKTYEYKFITQ